MPGASSWKGMSVMTPGGMAAEAYFQLMLTLQVGIPIQHTSLQSHARWPYLTEQHASGKMLSVGIIQALHASLPITSWGESCQEVTRVDDPCGLDERIHTSRV